MNGGIRVRIVLFVIVVVLAACAGLTLMHYRAEVQYSRRQFALEEVCRWLMRGESAIAIPPAVIRAENDEPRFSWRLQLVMDCLPTQTQLSLHPSWKEAAISGDADRGEMWMTRRAVRGPLMMGLVGNDTVFDPTTKTFPSRVPPNTILFIEVVRPDVHWMQPADIELDVFLNAPGDKIPDYVQSEVGDGFHVGFADSTVWFMSKDTPASLIADFARISKAEHLDRSTLLSAYRKR
jgi:hypothetical protein